ncbi:MAG: hypothetical protein MPW15_01140 [Candidatus Manganitrophus sp.]|nr:hypothetical protein [Candidatus Manganitrophus sp.]
MTPASPCPPCPKGTDGSGSLRFLGCKRRRGARFGKGPRRGPENAPEEGGKEPEQSAPAARRVAAAGRSAPALFPLSQSEEGPAVPILESGEGGSLSLAGSILDLLPDRFRTRALSALAGRVQAFRIDQLNDLIFRINPGGLPSDPLLNQKKHREMKQK